MTLDAREMALPGPAPVAVHDDGDVARQPIGMDLSGEIRLDASRWNPRQQLIDAHRIRFDPTWV
jgi:hypothetical protein